MPPLRNLKSVPATEVAGTDRSECATDLSNNQPTFSWVILAYGMKVDTPSSFSLY